MKRFLLAAVLVFSCGVAQAESFSEINWAEKLALYLPNRILDALDMFSVNLGIGPTVEARLMGTRAVDVGAGISLCNYKLYKDFNRQYGFGVEDGWYWSFISVGEEEFGVRDGSLMIDKYVECRAGVPSPEMRIYHFLTGARDYWAIGGSLGLGIDGNLYIHPVEWADFVLGFFLIDIRSDDLTFDSFRL